MLLSSWAASCISAVTTTWECRGGLRMGWVYEGASMCSMKRQHLLPHTPTVTQPPGITRLRKQPHWVLFLPQCKGISAPPMGGIHQRMCSDSLELTTCKNCALLKSFISLQILESTGKFSCGDHVNKVLRPTKQKGLPFMGSTGGAVTLGWVEIGIMWLVRADVTCVTPLLVAPPQPWAPGTQSQGAPHVLGPGCASPWMFQLRGNRG